MLIGSMKEPESHQNCFNLSDWVSELIAVYLICILPIDMQGIKVPLSHCKCEDVSRQLNLTRSIECVLDFNFNIELQ